MNADECGKSQGIEIQHGRGSPRLFARKGSPVLASLILSYPRSSVPIKSIRHPRRDFREVIYLGFHIAITPQAAFDIQ